jgi:predicted dehydrogenase
LKAGKHVWMEKPPAASSTDIEHLKSLAGNRLVMTGFKKMFFPANEKAKELMGLPDFGKTQLATIQYPMPIPEADEFTRYLDKREHVPSMISFLDHLCHPVSLLLFLMGMPQKLFFERASNGAGVATFSYADGRVATITLSWRSPHDGGMERTTVVSDRSRSIVVENNIRVRYHRDAPGRGYGSNPNYYVGAPEETSAVWEPEFSLGQLYNKGLFLLGYYGEVNEFARAILDRRPLSKCHLDHAWQATRIFEAFAGGPGKVIELG